MALFASIVDTHALLQLVWVSLLAGVGICLVYAVAVLGLARSLEHARAGRRPAATLFGVAAAIAIGVCGWAVVTGIAVMTQK